MRKVFPLCFVALIFAANAAAQSGRRVVNPPPPRAPVMEIPEYEKVRKEYAGRAVEFIGLTTEDPRTSSDRVKHLSPAR